MAFPFVKGGESFCMVRPILSEKGLKSVFCNYFRRWGGCGWLIQRSVFCFKW